MIWSPVVGWALLSCAVSVAHAQVDTSSPAWQTLDQQTPQLDLPDASTTAPVPTARSDSSNELGIRVGAFTLYPEISLLTGYDDNVFATPAPTSGSSFVVVRPQFELRSDWIRHQVRVLAYGDFGAYPSASTQNYQNYLLQADGKLDIRYDMSATGLIALRRSTEALGTPNVSFAQAPTVADSLPVELGFNHRFNRLFYQLTVSATKYWFYDYSTIISFGLPSSSRNRTEYEERFRVGYEISDNLSVFLAPSINQRVYVDSLNIAGQQRDSMGWVVNAGATWILGPKSTLEASVGTARQSYTMQGTTTSALIFSITGTWNGYEPLTLRPAINRSINESALTNYENYVSTVAGVDFTYDIHFPWKAVGGISYNQADYTQVPGLADINPRTDTFIKASIGLLYQVRPEYSIGPIYEYSQGSSTDPAAGGPQFTRNMFSIRLVAKR